jgi:uncharacterized protein HemX
LQRHTRIRRGAGKRSTLFQTCRKATNDERKLNNDERKLNNDERKLNNDERKLNNEERKLNNEERKLNTASGTQPRLPKISRSNTRI